MGTMRLLNDAQINWWNSGWWKEEQYLRLFEGRISMADVDARIMRVSRVFDAAWGKGVGRHPIHFHLLSTGTQPVQFLLGLGRDLQAVEKCLGVKSLIQDLRHPKEYESALLELTIGATLVENACEVEFRPRLPNGKEADIRCYKQEEQIFVETKKVRESDAEQAARGFSSLLIHELTSLVAQDGPLAGRGFNVELSPAVLSVFGVGPNADAHLIEGLVAGIVQQVVERVAKGQRSFELEGIGLFDFSVGADNCRMSSPYVNASVELRRVLRSHLTKAVLQLHKDFPGIVVIQSTGELNEALSRFIVTSMFSSMGNAAQHISAVLFLPVTYWMPTLWAMFNAFAVLNPNARVKAEGLETFKILSERFLSRRVATPGTYRADLM